MTSFAALQTSTLVGGHTVHISSCARGRHCQLSDCHGSCTFCSMFLLLLKEAALTSSVNRQHRQESDIRNRKHQRACHCAAEGLSVAARLLGALLPDLQAFELCRSSTTGAEAVRRGQSNITFIQISVVAPSSVDLAAFLTWGNPSTSSELLALLLTNFANLLPGDGRADAGARLPGLACPVWQCFHGACPLPRLWAGDLGGVSRLGIAASAAISAVVGPLPMAPLYRRRYLFWPSFTCTNVLRVFCNLTVHPKQVPMRFLLTLPDTLRGARIENALRTNPPMCALISRWT